MLNVLMVSREKKMFSEVMAGLENRSARCQWTGGAKEALSTMERNPFDLVIVEDPLPDMAGKKFVETLVMKNPMIHCVVCSGMAHEQFHETFEGLGVLMQFPLSPGKKEIETLKDHLKTIDRIANSIPPVPKKVGVK